MTAAASERVGRYQLLEPIGVGPNGTVSRAKVFGVAGFERQFAIKRFHPELTSTPALAQALSAAARAYGSLEHPRIARMSEFGVAQGTTFTAVEFVSGLDALRLIAEAKMAGAALAPGGALALVSQAARAIGYAHGRGLTHLGLAPTNVMITAEGDIKITDFGILAAGLPARPVEAPRLANRVPYLAPEQLANEATSAATDVFALGVLAYELVTGHRTFRGETPQQIAQSVMAGPPIEPPLPKPIVRVLQRCLARSPFERFPDARALADALDAALRVAPVPGTRKDIGAQVKLAMDRIAALHEGEMSGVLPLNIGTGPIRVGDLTNPPPGRPPPPPPPVAVGRSDDFATDEFAKLQPAIEIGPPPPQIFPPAQLPGATVPDLRTGAISTVTGVPPAPIPVPQGVSPPTVPPLPPLAGTNTLLGISGQRPPPIPGARPPTTPPPPAPASAAPARATPLPRLPTPRPVAEPPPAPAPAEELGPSERPTVELPPMRTDDPNERITTDLAIPHEPSVPVRAPAAPPPPPSPPVSLPAIALDDDDLEIAAELPPDGEPLFDPIPGAAAPPPPPGPHHVPREAVPEVLKASAKSTRTLIGVLPEEPVAFAGGTNVELKPAPGGQDEEPPLAPPPPPTHAYGPPPGPPAPPLAEPAGARPPPTPPTGAPYGGGHRLPSVPEAPPYPGDQGYPVATGLPMPHRDSALAGSLPSAGARARKRMLLIGIAIAAAIVLAAGGWALYGMFGGDDETAGGGSDSGGSDSGGPIASSGGDGGAALAVPADAGAGSTTGSATGPIARTAPDAAPEPPKPPSELSIVSTPPGARVFLDGADAGATPLKLPGTMDRHTVALLLPGYELYVAQVDGHGPFSIPLEKVKPNPDFAGIKVLHCKDANRYYVFVDGKHSGQTCPTERINTTLGPHTVEVYDVVTETRRKWEIDIKEGRLSYRIRIDP